MSAVEAPPVSVCPSHMIQPTRRQPFCQPDTDTGTDTGTHPTARRRWVSLFILRGGGGHRGDQTEKSIAKLYKLARCAPRRAEGGLLRRARSRTRDHLFPPQLATPGTRAVIRCPVWLVPRTCRPIYQGALPTQAPASELALSRETGILRAIPGPSSFPVPCYCAAPCRAPRGGEPT